MSLPPTPKPGEVVKWRPYWERYQWVRDLDHVLQDEEWHGEGDVGTHTWMVCQAMVDQVAWKQADENERALLFAAALFHDVSKPETTARGEDGRWHAHYHSVKGSFKARRILWEMGVPLKVREEITMLVRYHQHPFHFMKKTHPERHLAKLSLSLSMERLVMMATADNEGRYSKSIPDTRDGIALFASCAQDIGCLEQPFPFHNDHTRFRFCQKGGMDPRSQIYDDTKGFVVMMCGLPGSGKDHWAREHYSMPVLSLDAIRRENKLTNKKDQRKVVALAKDKAREYLRKHQPFVLNATNITKKIRAEWVRLFAGYNPKIRIVYLDVDKETLLSQNENREHPVSQSVLQAQIAKWEVPDKTEAHEVVWVENRNVVY